PLPPSPARQAPGCARTAARVARRRPRSATSGVVLWPTAPRRACPPEAIALRYAVRAPRARYLGCEPSVVPNVEAAPAWHRLVRAVFPERNRRARPPAPALDIAPSSRWRAGDLERRRALRSRPRRAR